MSCPVCKTENRPGAKFCQECAVRLELRCPFCGGATAAGAKFCTQCGSQCGSQQELSCPLCSAVTHLGAKFCQDCGTRLEFTCFTCGTLTPHGAKFCHMCGSRLETHCADCGAITLPGARFCNACGVALAPGHQPVQPYAPPQPQPAPVYQPPPPQPIQPYAPQYPQPPAPAAPLQYQQPIPMPQPQVEQGQAPAPQPGPAAYPAPVEPQYQPQPSNYLAPAPPTTPAVEPQPAPTPVEQTPPVQASGPDAAVGDVVPPPAQPIPSRPAPDPNAAPVIPMGREDERRLVTVLFGDVSGFTAMSEKLDPEDVKNIMDSCLKMLADQVDKYEGTVDKFEGDLIMATWGAPNLHEDDAERAALAAIGMQEALVKFSDNLQKRRGFTLRMRIGLNTGEVIFGTVGSGREKDYTVMGDVVNTASRFESSATPGRIMVGQTTHDLTRHLIEYEVLEPITVKGKVEPLQVYQVVGVKEERGQRRGIAGLESPMVGRSSEAQKLRQEVQKAMDERHPRLVMVLGTPGIGKSRLLNDLERQLNENAVPCDWLEGRSLPYGQAITYYSLGEMVKTTFGIKGSDSIEEVRERLLEGVKDVVRNSLPAEDRVSEKIEQEATQITHRLAYAIGVSFPDSIMNKINPANVKEELFWAWRQFFHRWAAAKPLVIVFEDLQWADEIILELVNHIVTTVAGVPIIFLCISRPELLERVPSWADEHPSRCLLHLTPLSPREGVTLIDNLLVNNKLSPRVKDKIVQKAGSVPFFIEEILRTLIDSRDIVEAPDGWVLADLDIDLKLPDTINATISARIDRLDLMEKSLIQRASVVGTDFWESSLAYPAPALGPEVLALVRLTQKEFIHPKPTSAFAGDDEYAFQNTLVRDVTYQGLTRARRSREHLRAGLWLEARAGDRLDELIELLAYHFGQAANVDVASMEGDYKGVVQAIHYLWDAGERARARQSNADALSHYDRALELLSEIKDLEGAPQEINGVDSQVMALNLFMGRAQTLEPLARYDDAMEDLEVVLKSGSTMRMRALALYQIARILRLKGEPALAEGKATEAAQLYQQIGDVAGNAQCRLVLGEVFSDQSKLSQFEVMAREATELGVQTGSLWVEARGSTLLGTACVYQGRPEEGLTQIEKAVAIYRDMGDRRGIATSLLMLGRVNHMTGRLKVAAQHIAESVEIFEELGDRRAMASASWSVGTMNVERGDLQAAQLHAERGIAFTSDAGETAMRIRCLLLLAQAQVESGNQDGAIEHLTETESLCIDRAQGSALPEVYRVMAQAYLGLGNLVEAEKYALKGCEVVAEDDPYSLGTTRLVYALVLDAKDDLEDAEQSFTKALAHLEEAGEEFELGLIHQCYGMFLMRRGQHELAREHLLKAKESFEPLEAQARLDVIDAAVEQIDAGLRSVASNP